MIMKIQKYAVAVAVLTAVSGSAMAATYTSDNGTITFHGMVNNNTCTISMKNEPLNPQAGNDFNVNLPTVNVADFTTSTAGVDSTLGKTPFTLVVDCAADTVASASAQFNSWAGTTSNNAGELVPPANVQGAAKNVSLVLHNDGNTKTDQIKIDQANNTQSVTLDANGHGELDYVVAYVGPATGVTSGSVQAQVAFTMNYK